MQKQNLVLTRRTHAESPVRFARFLLSARWQFAIHRLFGHHALANVARFSISLRTSHFRASAWHQSFSISSQNASGHGPTEPRHSTGRPSLFQPARVTSSPTTVNAPPPVSPVCLLR